MVTHITNKYLYASTLRVFFFYYENYDFNRPEILKIDLDISKNPLHVTLPTTRRIPIMLLITKVFLTKVCTRRSSPVPKQDKFIIPNCLQSVWFTLKK